MENQIVFKFPSFIGLLGIAFIVLKLVGVINWSWWLVLIPLYVPILCFIFMLIILGLKLYICIWQYFFGHKYR